ncbi:hypothetical protein EYF80_022915 [Liparis tanakae]|uniref:Uncharacterized protein n=1 Tax=Liparis tanakae TaxID=230148 RepID=A0A4Z2HLY8_9TELE|nr:hypothetical protein EYF80_022915 [Liparis tanakae]
MASETGNMKDHEYFCNKRCIRSHLEEEEEEEEEEEGRLVSRHQERSSVAVESSSFSSFSSFSPSLSPSHSFAPSKFQVSDDATTLTVPTARGGGGDGGTALGDASPLPPRPALRPLCSRGGQTGSARYGERGIEGAPRCHSEAGWPASASASSSSSSSSSGSGSSLTAAGLRAERRGGAGPELEPSGLTGSWLEQQGRPSRAEEASAPASWSRQKERGQKSQREEAAAPHTLQSCHGHSQRPADTFVGLLKSDEIAASPALGAWLPYGGLVRLRHSRWYAFGHSFLSHITSSPPSLQQKQKYSCVCLPSGRSFRFFGFSLAFLAFSSFSITTALWRKHRRPPVAHAVQVVVERQLRVCGNTGDEITRIPPGAPRRRGDADGSPAPENSPASMSKRAKSPMRTSPFTVHFWVSQFGLQLWFMKRDEFPFGPASITRS